MKSRLTAGSLLVFLFLTSPLHAESYQLSGKSYETTWPRGPWSGSLSFSGVYCATAPAPETAQRLTEAMFNQGAIYVGKMEYPDQLLLAVAVSSIPNGRSEQEEIGKLLATNRANQEQATKASLVYEVTELTTRFGPTLGIRINNIESDTPNSGPFPLVRRLVKTPDGRLLSMSVNRLFVRGSNRFEVAAMQLAPQPRTSSTEQDMLAHLTSMVEALTQSLQKCTEAMPLKVPQ